jgi:hydroxymethylpyrimidine/phosphomethylpyrimidine kinase
VEDLLIVKGEVVSRISHKRDGRVVRGTGCAFSSAFLVNYLIFGELSNVFYRTSLFLERFRSESFISSGFSQFYSAY